MLGKPEVNRKTAIIAKRTKIEWLKIFCRVKWKRKRRKSYQIFASPAHFWSIRKLSVFRQLKANTKNFWVQIFVIGLNESRKIILFFSHQRISGLSQKKTIFLLSSLKTFQAYHLEWSERLKGAWTSDHLERNERLKGPCSTYHLERSEIIKGS